MPSLHPDLRRRLERDVIAAASLPGKVPRRRGPGSRSVRPRAAAFQRKTPHRPPGDKPSHHESPYRPAPILAVHRVRADRALVACPNQRTVSESLRAHCIERRLRIPRNPGVSEGVIGPHRVRNTRRYFAGIEMSRAKRISAPRSTYFHSSEARNRMSSLSNSAVSASANSNQVRKSNGSTSARSRQ